MPTKKPIIQTVMDEETHRKFKEICKKEDRTESKMAAIIIRKYIEDYEKQNGKLISQEPSISKIG